MGISTKRPYNWTKGSTPPEVRIMRRLLQEFGPLKRREALALARSVRWM